MKEIIKYETHYIVYFKNELELDPIIIPNEVFKSIDKEIKKYVLPSGDRVRGGGHTHLNLILHGKDCWIKKGELEILKQANIKLEDIKVVAYKEGLLGPYTKSKTTATTIDGYEIFILN